MSTVHRLLTDQVIMAMAPNNKSSAHHPRCVRSVLEHDLLELGQILAVLRQLLRVALAFFLFVLLAVGWPVEGALAARAESEAAGGALAEVVLVGNL